ncbi:hypothetical protein Hrd1104_12075 [Halorhabdus sp. CBA1104]|uniref:hypothetical protein n=1 Tax=unclassified Halorhabdus TaxID=2621901 RepID=UPI0012B1F526|nr:MULTISPECIES: hypothetical protein [unclassified Halorhabdus]QGN07958.1 hypothetical protein Hrd1104_12075 [Halorhabdus sp. CBA1104]
MSEYLPALSGRTYRRVDTASKLAGLAVATAALEVGPTTAAGIVLVVIGAILATATVFIENQ